MRKQRQFKKISFSKRDLAGSPPKHGSRNALYRPEFNFRLSAFGYSGGGLRQDPSIHKTQSPSSFTIACYETTRAGNSASRLHARSRVFSSSWLISEKRQTSIAQQQTPAGTGSR